MAFYLCMHFLTLFLAKQISLGEYCERKSFNCITIDQIGLIWHEH